MASTSAKVSIASNLLGLAAFGLAWHGWPEAPVFDYRVLKLLHIVGVVIFMGNIVVGPLWIAFAWFSKSDPILAFAAKTLAAADIWLTAPGIQLTLWNGVLLAPTFGGVKAQPWLSEALLWVLATSVFATLILLPVQERFVELAQREGRSPAALKAFAAWSALGTLVSLPFLRVAWLMVAKSA